MAEKTKTIYVSGKEGTFSSIIHKFKGSKKDYDYSEISEFRQLLSNERARLLHIIKTKEPSSIYELAKLLGRDFKSVRQDIRLLEKFGFVELIAANKNNRERLKPVVEIDKLIVHIDI